MPGVATGLAVTGAGGDVAVRRGVAGRPGDRRDRADAHRPARRRDEGVGADRLSFLRSHGAELELPVADLKDRGVHIHVPGGRGAQGRAERGRHDGDRAGVAAVRAAGPYGRGHDRRGLPDRSGPAIGGVKQKLLAAHRAGITDRADPRSATRRTWTTCRGRTGRADRAPRWRRARGASRWRSSQRRPRHRRSRPEQPAPALPALSPAPDPPRASPRGNHHAWAAGTTQARSVDRARAGTSRAEASPGARIRHHRHQG